MLNNGFEKAFAVRLRANAAYAESLHFTVANLGVLEAGECRALADLIEAAIRDDDQQSAPSSGNAPSMMWGCEVGSPEWYAIAERTEWATVGAVARDAQSYLVGFGFRYSALDVVISLCEARAKKGWRSFVAVGAVPASSAEGGKSPEPPPTFGGEPAAIGSRWKHLKTGGIYIVVGPSIIERTNEPAILYQREGDGTLWVRPTDEFLDGRFELVDQPPAADALRSRHPI